MGWAGFGLMEEDERSEEALERLVLESHLGKALERDELTLHYQPQFDIDGNLVGAEALIRWLHPQQGMIPPGRFIPLAEKTGHIATEGDVDWSRTRAYGLGFNGLYLNLAGREGQGIVQPGEADELLDEFLTRYIESQVYRGAVENFASEMAAKMVAMKSATDNAGEIIDGLQLEYNKARQAAITQEISEIVGGAAAVSG